MGMKLSHFIAIFVMLHRIVLFYTIKLVMIISAAKTWELVVPQSLLKDINNKLHTKLRN